MKRAWLLVLGGFTVGALCGAAESFSCTITPRGVAPATETAPCEVPPPCEVPFEQVYDDDGLPTVFLS